MVAKGTINLLEDWYSGSNDKIHYGTDGDQQAADTEPESDENSG